MVKEVPSVGQRILSGKTVLMINQCKGGFSHMHVDNKTK